jgi:cytochrome c-type biogenesis protein CcmF
LASVAIGTVGVFLILAKNPNWGVGLEPGATVAGFWQGSTIPLTIAVSLLLFFCVFVATTNLWRAIELAKRSKLGIGPFVAHFGIAVLLSGLIISKSLERTEIVGVRDGEPKVALGHKIAFKDFDADRYYDRSNIVKFDVTDPDGRQHVIEPNLYYIPNGGMKETAQSWPYIERSLSHDMYYFLKAPIVEIFDGPMNLKPGETKVNSDFTIKYLEMTRKGQPGQDGVQFGAKLEVSFRPNEKAPYEKHVVTPTLTMSSGRLLPTLTQVSPDFQAALMSMNANDRSVDVQIFLKPPLYPIQVFYKPLTCLVWIGTGIFTLGGFIAAFYRRLVKKSPEGDFVANSAKIDSKK